MPPRQSRKNELPFSKNPTATPAKVLELIEAHYADMSPGLRAVADYILHTPSTFFFLPVQELAAKALVSHATVIRFCKKIGYKGFYEFSRDVQQVMQAELSSINRFDITEDFLDSLQEETSFFRNILDMEIKSLISASERVTQEDITTCVAMLGQADHIFVLGQMASLSLAVHMEQMLSKVADNIHLVPPWSLQTVSMLQRITEHSALVVFAFPRYPQATVDFTAQAREKGCGVIAITNSHLSPVAKYADKLLNVPVAVLSYVDLYGAPMAVGTALAVEFSKLNAQRTTEKLREFDKAVVRQHLFTR